ncbi:leucyl/phenylalanyl-tRNA--protein transferase [Halomonas sediminis]
MLPWLPSAHAAFPPVALAMDSPNGLLAAGGELTPAWLVQAYRQGIFPWYSEGDPILWWSPNPRMVLFPGDFKCRRSLAKRLRNGGFSISVDQHFHEVVDACAAPRQGEPGTWITAEMKAAYARLHSLGIAHSIEVHHNQRLVGGLYGLAMGPVFFGESMFSEVPDASKAALAHLADAMVRQGGNLIDCQMHTPHLASLGATTIARPTFINYLENWLPDNAFEVTNQPDDPPVVPPSPWLDAIGRTDDEGAS